MNVPKVIWLIDVGDEIVWCDCPEPSDGIDVAHDVEGPYVLRIEEEDKS